MESPRNVIVPVVGAVALALCVGLSACSKQPTNQANQTAQEQRGEPPQSPEQRQASQPPTRDQEQRAEQPRSPEQQQANRPPTPDPQQRAEQQQAPEQQQASRPPTPDQQQHAEQQRAEQPQNQNDRRQSASNGQSETAAVNLNRDQIEQIQRTLNQKGFRAGRPDGKMGSQTERALRSFQQQQRLEATGQLDQQTLAALGFNNLTQSTTGRAGGKPPPSGQ